MADGQMLAAQATKEQVRVMVTYHDDCNLPRAYGDAPKGHEDVARRIALTQLEKYIAKKNALGYGLCVEDFTLAEVEYDDALW